LNTIAHCSADCDGREQPLAVVHMALSAIAWVVRNRRLPGCVCHGLLEDVNDLFGGVVGLSQAGSPLIAIREHATSGSFHFLCGISKWPAVAGANGAGAFAGRPALCPA